MADVIEINDVRDLDSLQLTWNALVAGTPRASFFQTYDWFRSYWQHFGEGQKLRLLVVRAAGRAIGIVPLCVRRERYTVGTLRVLTYPLHDWGVWYGAIGADQAATMFMAMRYLQQSRRDWDLMDLRWCRAQEQETGRTARAMRAAGWSPSRRRYQETSVVDLSTGWDDYLGSRTGKWRGNIRRQLRQLDTMGDIEFHRHRPESAAEGDGDPHWEFFDACVAIASRSWQGSSATGNTLSHIRVRQFLRETHQAAARLGKVDMCLLTVNSTPAAFAYNYHWDQSLFGLRMGFDSSISQRGLGSALMFRMLEDSCNRKDKQLDLGIGEQPFKNRFRTGVEESYAISYSPLTSWRGQRHRLGQWLKRQTRSTVANVGQAERAEAS